MPSEQTFHDNGNIKAIRLTDEKGNTSVTEFDALGREIRYTSSNGTERITIYTAAGNRRLTWCIHDNGSQTITLIGGDDIKTISI